MVTIPVLEKQVNETRDSELGGFDTLWSGTISKQELCPLPQRLLRRRSVELAESVR